ncbi:MAG: 50S ribosomal protein L4 [Clostridiaceae bacterium]|jgi:large subunit ribosomal protein L4|nr:50S ribosomal protein L4 [Bacillota bacterium]NLN51775.1 50S ribosomal protein L4 [Clostridiaceae bacterium]
MAKTNLYNMQGEIVGDIELEDAIFGIEPNEDVVHRIVKNQLANRRQGTSKVKNRSEVRGGGRKPHRQKGTGRARQGSIRAGNHVGGGVIFGPTPRDFSYKTNKKMRRLAMKSILSQALSSDRIKVLDKLELEQIKTKDMVNTINNLKLDGSALFVIAEPDSNIEKSTANIKDVKTIWVNTMNVFDLVKYNNIVFTNEAVNKVQEVYV